LEATESLASIITGMPAGTWPLPAATEIATRLIALLPKQSAKTAYIPQTSASGAKARCLISIGIVLVWAALAVAYQAGAFTSMDASKPHASDATSFATSNP
ncbi:MAG: hypothetical protein ACRECE_01955, partial [Xanthobacteraceae bacterium]